MDGFLAFEDLALVIGAFPAAFIVITCVVKLVSFIRNLFADETEHEAVILEKRRTTEYRNSNSAKNGYNIPYRVDFYFLIVKTEKRKKMKLKVDTKDYDSVKEGDRGILILKGKKFISFKKMGANVFGL